MNVETVLEQVAQGSVSANSIIRGQHDFLSVGMDREQKTKRKLVRAYGVVSGVGCLRDKHLLTWQLCNIAITVQPSPVASFVILFVPLCVWGFATLAAMAFRMGCPPGNVLLCALRLDCVGIYGVLVTPLQ